MNKLKLDKNSLRKFGITMALALSVITLIILIRHRQLVWPTSILALLFLFFAFVRPGFLKYIYISWMKLAFILGWINTRLILCILFFIVFAPMGFILRMLRIDLLDRKFKENEASYWKKKETVGFDKSNYERQF